MEIIRIDWLQRIAEFIEALLVERFCGHGRFAPVARHHVRPAGADLQLAVVRHQLGFVARHRQPDMAGAAGLRRHAHEERGRLGGAEPGQHRHPQAGGLHRQLVERIPDVGRKSRTGKEHRMQLAEELVSQSRIFAEIWQQRFIALGHVEIDRRRNLPEIAHGLFNAGRRRLALVEIHRTAVEQGQADIVIAAEGVIPGQPVDDDGRLVPQEGKGVGQHDLVGADHALSVDHGFRLAGRPRGQQEFRDRIRPDGCVGIIQPGTVRRRQQLPQRRDGAAGDFTAADGDFGLRGNIGEDRVGKNGGIVGEHQTRRQQADDMSELAVIFRDQ